MVGNPVMTVDPLGLNPAAGCVLGLWAGPVGCGIGTALGVGIGLGAVLSTPGDTPIENTNEAEIDSCEENDCHEILKRIKYYAKLMETERDKALADKNDLYNRAYTKPLSSHTKWGTWFGHETKFYNHKRGLIKAIREADRMGCPVPPGDRQKLYWQFPKKPKGV